MNIKNLLNPEGENIEASRVWTNKDIFWLVEEEEKEENNESKEKELEETHINPPKKSEVCHILSKLLLYLDQDHGNDQFTNLAPVLEEFQQELLKQLHFGGQQAGIKDFFQPISQSSANGDALPDLHTQIA